VSAAREGPFTTDRILAELSAERTLRALHGEPTQGRPAAAEEAAPREPPPWDGDPVPLSARRLLPPFPVDALPGWVGDQVAAVAEATQTPPDLAGCIALAALSTAAGGRARVQVRPGWVEPVNIYTVVAMPPGSRKSAVFAAMIAPLLIAEQQLVEATHPRLVDAELAARVARARAERTAKAAENALSTEARDELLAEASDAALTAAGMTVPVLPRLIADDVTVEAAASLLAEQNGRLAVLSAEGGIFATLAGRYSSGQPNLEVFLKGHAGDLLRVDRKGRPAEHVPQPALTLGLAVQPEVLRDIARMPGFRGRGLLARILYSQPPNTVGRRRIGASPVPERVEVAYGQGLRDLVHTAAAWPEPLTIPLSATADARVLQQEAELEPHLASEGSLGHIADWASKITGATIRIAGLLHLAHASETSAERPVDALMVDAAARLGRYYLGHALGVFDAMGAEPAIDDARTLLHWILRAGGAFSRRDLFAGVSRGRFRKVGDLDPGLSLLVEHGYLRQIDVARTGPGRPSVHYEVHPAAAETAESAEP
jgi:replicative DNA helicase